MSDDCVPRRSIGQMWTPLQSAFGVRILKLLPGLDKQPIECVLDTASLDGEDCRYQALSYTWGSLDHMLDITCNGMTFAITRNLHSALLRLRGKEHVVPLWVDALYINQSQDSQALREREAQVQLMWIIFPGRKKLSPIWGETVDHQEDFEDFLWPFRNLPDNPRTSAEVTGLKAGEYGLPGMQHACWPTLAQVLSQDYFQRVWIIQECVLATKLEFLLGTARYGADFLEILLQARLYGRFLAAKLASGVNLALEEGDVDLSISNVASFFSALSHDHPREIMALRKAWWANNAPEWKLFRQSMVHEKMLNCASHEAMDKRDKIYSLLGLLFQDGHRVIEVDYSDTVENLARRTTLYLLRAGVGPQHLYKCVRCQTSGPSWAINLSQSSDDRLDNLMTIDQSCEYFNACGSSTFRLQPGKDDSRLLADAVILDRVTDMSSRITTLVQALGPSGTELTDWLLSLFSWIEALKSNASIDGGFDALDMWRTLTADLDINRNRQFCQIHRRVGIGARSKPNRAT